MLRKMRLVLLSAMLLCSVSMRANAMQWEGTIRVSLDAGELPVINGSVTLYQVGVPVDGGYRITECFGGGLIKQEDVFSENLAQWLAESAEANGKTLYLDVEGDATFTNLQDGLYLVVQTEAMEGFHLIDPFLTVVGGEFGTRIHVQPKTEPIIWENPQTGQPIMPLLGAMGMVGSGIALYLCIDGKRKK